MGTILRSSAYHITLILGLACGSTGCYEAWTDAVRITPSQYTGVRVGDIAVDMDGRIHILYTGNSGGPQITSRTSYDGGQSYPVGATVGTNIHDYAMGMQLLTDHAEANRLFAAWNPKGAGSTFPEVSFSTSINGGNSWSPPRNLAAGTPSSDVYCNNQLAQRECDGMLAVAFQSVYEGTETQGIYITTSANDGVSWSPPSPIGNWADRPNAILTGLEYAEDGSLVVVYGHWRPGGTRWHFVRRSTDNGVTWTTSYNCANSGVPESTIRSGALVRAGTDLHFFWHMDDRLGHTVSKDNGYSWALDGRHEFSERGYFHGLRADYSPADLRVTLSYTLYEPDFRGSNLFVREFDGATWSNEVRINNKFGEVRGNAGIAFQADGTAHAAWGDLRYDESYHEYTELVAARSEANSPDSWMVRFNGNTVFHEAARGDVISFDYTLGNPTGTDGTFDVWVEYKGFNGATGVMQRTSGVALATGDSRTFTYTRAVNPRTPIGNWEVIVFVGNYPNGKIASDIFEVAVTR